MTLIYHSKKPFIHVITGSLMLIMTLIFVAFVGQAVADSDIDGNEDEMHEDGPIQLTAAQIKRTGIDLAITAAGGIREALPVYGVVETNAEQVQTISARFDGVIRKITKRIGDAVVKGDLLATVEADESLRVYSIKSSLNGVITQRNVNVGEQTEEKILLVVEDLSSVWIDLSLFPSDIAKVQIGQQARVKSIDNTVVAEGAIIYIAPYGSSVNQSITARVLIDNVEGHWKPGQFVSAEITLSEVVAPLVILNTALQVIDGEEVVFVKGEDGFEAREITLGRTDGEKSEVLAGLSANETYVSKNSFVLKSELGKGDVEDDD